MEIWEEFFKVGQHAFLDESVCYPDDESVCYRTCYEHIDATRITIYLSNNE